MDGVRRRGRGPCSPARRWRASSTANRCRRGRRGDPCAGHRGRSNHKKSGGRPDRETLGRSRDGLTAKIHLAAADPLPTHLAGHYGRAKARFAGFPAGGGRHRVSRLGRGRPPPGPLRCWPTRPTPGAIRSHLRKRGIAAVIPEPSDQQANQRKRGAKGGRPPAFDPEQYKRRNTVGRCISKLIATSRRRHSVRQARLHLGAAPSISRPSGSGSETPFRDPRDRP